MQILPLSWDVAGGDREKITATVSTTLIMFWGIQILLTFGFSCGPRLARPWIILRQGRANGGLPGATRHGPLTIQARAELTSRPVRVLLPAAHADGVLTVVAAVYVEFDVRVLAQASVYSTLNGAAFRTRAHAFALPLTGLVRGLWNQGESRTSESDPTVPAPGRFESPLHRSGLDLLVVEFDSVEIALEIVEET